MNYQPQIIKKKSIDGKVFYSVAVDVPSMVPKGVFFARWAQNGTTRKYAKRGAFGFLLVTNTATWTTLAEAKLIAKTALETPMEPEYYVCK